MRMLILCWFARLLSTVVIAHLWPAYTCIIGYRKRFTQLYQRVATGQARTSWTLWGCLRHVKHCLSAIQRHPYCRFVVLTRWHLEITISGGASHSDAAMACGSDVGHTDVLYLNLLLFSDALQVLTRAVCMILRAKCVYFFSGWEHTIFLSLQIVQENTYIHIVIIYIYIYICCEHIEYILRIFVV